MKHSKIISLCLLLSLLLTLLCGCLTSPNTPDPSTEASNGSVSLDQGTGDAAEETQLPSQDTIESTGNVTDPSDEPTEPTGSTASTEPSDTPTEPTESTASTEPSDTPTEPAAPAFSLVGTWTSVRRDGNELNTSYFVFEEDGTGYSSGCCYMNVHNDVEINPDCETDEAGWYVAPMGYPGDRFTYKLENGVLSITYTGGDMEDYAPFTVTHTLQILGDDLISLHDRYGKYTREDLSLKALCALMGVNYDPSAASTSLLVGKWQSVYRDSSDCLNVHSWTFGADGIASPYSTWYDHSSNKHEGVSYGEPDEGGWCEMWDESDYNSYTYSLDNGVLTLVFTYGEHMSPEDVGRTSTYTLEWIDDNTIILTRYNKSTTYVRSDDLSLKELCELLNVDYSVH